MCVGHWVIAQGWATLPLCWTNDAGDCMCGRHHSPKDAGKAPLTPHGVHNATTDPARVDRWHAQWANANWGVACGPVTVVDIDDAELASRLTMDPQLLANHFMVTTPGRNGVHIYVHERDGDSRNHNLNRADGSRIGEVRGVGGYVVAPGSVRAGKAYEKLTENASAEVDNVDTWIADVLGRHGVELKPPQSQAPASWQPLASGDVDAPKAVEKALKALGSGKAESLSHLLYQPGAYKEFESRSEADYFAVSSLIEGGLSDPEAAAVWVRSELGKRKKVRTRPDYVAMTIANSRAALGARAQDTTTTVGSTQPSEREMEYRELEGQLTEIGKVLARAGVTLEFKSAVERAIHRILAIELPSPGNRAPSPAELARIPSPGPLLIAAAPGVGKTHEVVRLAEEVWSYPSILHLAPSHKSFDNVTRQAGWGHWQGHSDGKDNEPPCPRYVRANKGYTTGDVCTCGADTFGTDTVSHPTFAPVEYVLSDSPDGDPLRKTALSYDLWVFDDIGMDKFVNTMVISRRDAALTEQLHPGVAVRTLARALLALLDEHTAMNEGKPHNREVHWSGAAFYEHLETVFMSSGSSIRDWLHAWEGEPAQQPEAWLTGEGYNDPQSWPYNFGPLLGGLLLDYVLGSRGNPRVHLVWSSPEPGKQRKQSIIRIRSRKYVPRRAVSKCVVLDATADPVLLSQVLGKPAQGEERLEITFPPNMRVVQLLGAHLSRVTAEHFQDDGAVTLHGRYRKLLQREMSARRGAGQAAKVGLITFQSLEGDCIKALQEEGYNPADLVTDYYWNLRGANDFMGCDVLVLVGYPYPNPQGLYEEACALFSDDTLSITQEREEFTEHTKLRNGNSAVVARPVRGYKDNRLQALLLQKSHAELYQALHRARPFAPDTTVKEVLVFTDVPIPGVPVDTFFGREGRVFDTLEQLLQSDETDDTVLLPDLINAVFGKYGTGAWGANPEKARTNLDKWMRKNNHGWLADATGTEYERGESRGKPGRFRRRVYS